MKNNLLRTAIVTAKSLTLTERVYNPETANKNVTHPEAKGWRQPAVMLMIMAAAMQLSFASWSALQYNFALEKLSFGGAEIGIQQSIREIPGFLSFAAVYLLFALREQTLALVSLTLLGLGVAATGFFETPIGFYMTTFIGSIGFHYYETMHQSLTLQWLPKKTAPKLIGRIYGVSGAAQLIAYAGVFGLGLWLSMSFASLFVVAGIVTIVFVIFMATNFQTFKQKSQTKKLVIRKKYWLYYTLTFMTGARRQIFIVFASWMMVERFGYKFTDIAALFLVNALVVMSLAPSIGILIGKIGEKKALIIEYTGLVIVFAAYAFVQNPIIAIGLYIFDHAFFSFDIALKTYFQKIANPEDIASTTGVAFTINHIAAVFIPVLFGLLWLVSPAAVFLAGAAMAAVSFGFAIILPKMPRHGVEVIWKEKRK